MQDQVNDTRNQIPILGDIPLIGNTFKEKGGSISKTELIVLITPASSVMSTKHGKSAMNIAASSMSLCLARVAHSGRWYKLSKGPSTDCTIRA